MSFLDRFLNRNQPKASGANIWVCMFDQVVSKQEGLCPRCGKPLTPRMEIALTFTEKENEAIRTERQLWTSSVPLEPDQRLIVHPKMANAIDALGLIEYVRTLVAAAHDLPQSERGVVLEEATKVQIKAYVMHGPMSSDRTRLSAASVRWRTGAVCQAGLTF